MLQQSIAVHEAGAKGLSYPIPSTKNMKKPRTGPSESQSKSKTIGYWGAGRTSEQAEIPVSVSVCLFYAIYLVNLIVAYVRACVRVCVQRRGSERACLLVVHTHPAPASGINPCGCNLSLIRECYPAQPSSVQSGPVQSSPMRRKAAQTLCRSIATGGTGRCGQ